MADLTNPRVPPETDAAISAWMRGLGWKVAAARWEMDPESGFHVWQEDPSNTGKSHALWVAEPMVRHLSAEQLVGVLNRERVADEIRINFKVRIEERGDEYRISVVPRRSGEWKALGMASGGSGKTASPGPTILIVEDERMLRQVMNRTLAGLGYRVVAAENGAVAWELLQLAEVGIDAVVSDVVMPKLSGLELATRLATLPKPPPIVLVSGYAKPTMEVDCPFLPKPFTSDQLGAAVRQVLDGAA